MVAGKKQILFICITMLLCLTGCGPFSDRKASESVQGPQVNTDTQETQEDAALEEPADGSIACKDWKVKENPIEGTDNIYELIIDEWSGDEGWVIAMEPYRDQVLVLKQSMEGVNSLYLIHPLLAEVKASVELPQGMYIAENLTIDNDGCIRVGNLETAEIYIYNESLEEQSRIKLHTASAGTMVLSQNRMSVYYADYEKGKIFCYHVDTDETEELFPDLSFEFSNGDVTGLLDNDSCLTFNYYDTERDGLLYEIRALDSGEVLYQDTASIVNVASDEEHYAFLREDNEVYEYVYGKDGEELPKIISFRDYGEYNGCKHMCLRQKALFSGVQVDNAQKEYQAVTGKECPQGQSVSKLSFNQYDLTSGMRPYAMDFYYIQDEDEYITNYDVVYIPEADCAVCYIEASTKRWLVWDLTKESSATGDAKSYLYDWQDPAKPDQEGLKAMRKRAGEIGQTYGVEIYLGDELSSCPSDVYKYEVSNNIIRIEKALDILEKALEKYPKGMLAQLETEENSRLKIYLANDILPIDESAIDTSIGIQNITDGITFLVLDINSWADLENTIYHEIFHAIEMYLNMDDSAFFDYEVWDALNPEGFEYDYDYHVNEENQNWDYVAGEAGENAYFIDVYAKSFPNEDRARIMEYAMMDDTDPRKSNVRHEGIKAKLRYISEQIRNGFDTSGWQEVTVWEEVLKTE